MIDLFIEVVSLPVHGLFDVLEPLCHFLILLLEEVLLGGLLQVLNKC